MIDEHVQESAVEGSRAILAWSQGSALRYAQRSTVATRWHCCAVLASAIPKTDEIPSYALSPRITSPKMMNPIGRVCVSSRVCSQFLEIRKRKSAWKSDVGSLHRSVRLSGVPRRPSRAGDMAASPSRPGTISATARFAACCGGGAARCVRRGARLCVAVYEKGTDGILGEGNGRTATPGARPRCPAASRAKTKNERATATHANLAARR